MKKRIHKDVSHSIFILAFLAVTVFFESCYTYHIKPTDITVATEYSKDTIRWYYCWGLWQGPQPVPSCHRNGLAEVEVHTNFGGSMLTLVTLGIVHPVHVRWKCHQCTIIE